MTTETTTDLRDEFAFVRKSARDAGFKGDNQTFNGLCVKALGHRPSTGIQWVEAAWAALDIVYGKN